ncbi:MAG: hypothetical protein JNM10_15010, partial [Planctomycetia bacterium]|nr:hypothetical protein [Planctomycetia bacterium]
MRSGVAMSVKPGTASDAPRAATAGATSGSTPPRPVRPRVRWRAVLLGVAFGLGPVLVVHVHARTRASADDVYAHRLADAVGDRAREMLERLARLEQDLATCATFAHRAVVPREVLDASARALRARHPILEAVTCDRAEAANGGVDARALAAARDVVASGRPRLAALARATAEAPARGTLVVPWSAAADAPGDVVFAVLGLDAWLAPVAGSDDDAALDVA